ncbi:roadblock/LC7 domain-containing protein [Flavobacterium sp. FlaQc-48]|uniref:roadblock/LC7 domain-containing protein n=1 Tax=Flavobacterium sp. FlaQc-48 TaxID=3374181 RepID=UPI0037576BAE
MIDIDTLINETGADSGLIFNTDGILIKSVNLQYDHNVAAMMGIIIKMCQEFTDDLENGLTRQVMIKNNNGIVVANIDSYDNCVALLSKDNTRIGLLLLKMDAAFRN